ncbi:cytochrome P450 4V2-like [Helicoverpa zea]|uniref:cytochrome P450 4V2-like n=1 Tax=Helicoverpa zea TaxID=7113 RepID=UPI001F5A9E04|nr:cytochrome P450 4V2-like [Helicoverpa zea]
MVLGVLIVACCVVFAVWRLVKPRSPSPKVYPGALPLLGHLFQLAGDNFSFWEFTKNLNKFCLKNDDICQIRLGPHRCYVLSDPAESLMIANTYLEKPYLYDFAKEMFSCGLVTATVSTWKPHRKLLNPSFSVAVLNTFLPEFNTQARNLLSTLSQEVGKPAFNIQLYLVNSLMKTVCRTSLGQEKEKQDLIDKDYAYATKSMFALYVERLQKFWLHIPFIFNLSPLKTKHDKLMKIAKDIMDKVMSDRKLKLKATYIENIQESTKDKFKPLVDQLLELGDKQDGFTDDEIRAHLDTVVSAAYDTTSTVMTYTWMLVGTYPKVQERIYEELISVLGSEDRDVTRDDLPDFVYLEAIVKEALRLYPPVPTIARNITSDVQIREYSLSAGSSCLIPVYGINRHPSWGPDADEFNPDRWLHPDTLPDKPSAFASFSIGKRNCIGRKYAMMVMKTTLAHIFRRYRVLSDINSVPTSCDIMIKPASTQQIALEIRT